MKLLFKEEESQVNSPTWFWLWQQPATNQNPKSDKNFSTMFGKSKQTKKKKKKVCALMQKWPQETVTAALKFLNKRIIHI